MAESNVAGAISAGGLIIGPIVGAAVNRGNVKKTIKANKDLAEYQYSKDLEMWNRQNEYNLPRNQIQRYKDAGLSPALMYPGGGGNAGNSSTLPHYNAPRVDYTPASAPQIDFAGALASYQDSQMRQAQIDNVKAQTTNVESRTMNEQIRNFLLKMQGRGQEIKNETSEMSQIPSLQILQNKAQQSEAGVQQEWQRLTNMSAQQQLLILDQQSKQLGLTTEQLKQEQQRANILFMKYKNEWMKQGITTSDSPILRMIVRQMTEAGADINDIFKNPDKPVPGLPPNTKF